MVVVWHLLSDPRPAFIDLGADYYDNHVRQLEALRLSPVLNDPFPAPPGAFGLPSHLPFSD